MEANNQAQKLVRKGKHRKLFFAVLYTLSLSVLIVSSLRIFSYYVERSVQKNTKNQMLLEAVRPALPSTSENSPTASDTNETSSDGSGDINPSLTQPLIPDISVDFSVLCEKYPGIVGWLYIPGDLLSDPVMQAADNDYYLYRLPNGKDNAAGSLFFDFRDSPSLSGWNHLIYGHNMKNRTMFGFLRNYRSSDFFQDHPYVFYFTEDCTYRIELFAGFNTVDDSFVYSRPADELSCLEYLKKAKQKSLFSSDVNVGANDPILVLSTCAGSADSNKRFVVMGKAVPLS